MAYQPRPPPPSSSSSGYYPPNPQQQPPQAYNQPPQAYNQPPQPNYASSSSYAPPAANGGWYPPQQQQQQQPYGEQQQQSVSFDPQSFLQDAAAKVIMNPNAWQSLGGQAWQSGESYVKQNLRGWHSWRRYWNVSNFYVLSKLQLVLFPFRHKNWNRLVDRSETSGQIEGFKSPRHDVNAPDLYIPVMSFVTYILLVGTRMGLENRFKPDVLTITASTALFFLAVQVLTLRLGMYLLNVSTGANDAPVFLTDLIAYCGYQFVSIIFVQLCSRSLDMGWLKVLLFAYTALALGWFTLRSLRHVVLSSSGEAGNAIANTGGVLHRKRRVYFLFLFVLLQVFCVWWLC